MQYTFKDINQLLSQGVEVLEKKFPMPWKEVWKDESEKVCVHTRGREPKWLVDAFPNESDVSKLYRKANYQAVTMGYVNSWSDTFSTALLESNFSFAKSNPDFDTKYADFKQDGYNYWQWVNKRAFRRRRDDPNGLLAILPDRDSAALINISPDPEQPPVTDNSAQLEVVLELVNSQDIFWQDEDLLIFKCSQNSMVYEAQDKTQTETKTGKVYYAITPTDYFVYEQIGEKEKNKFKLTQLYTHNLGSIPAVVLGGIPTLWESDKDTYYKSNYQYNYSFKEKQFKEYFHSDLYPAIAHGNTALRRYYILMCTENRVGFPLIEVPDIPCAAEGCKSGYVFDREGQRNACGTCKGTGRAPWPSPSQGISVRPLVKNFAGEMQDTNGIQIKHVDPNDVFTMNSQYKDAINEFRECLQLRYVEMAQSGLAKQTDRADREISIANFADYWYDIFNTSLLNYLNQLWFPKTQEKIQLNKPISFKIEDIGELTADYYAVVTAGVTSGVRYDSYSDLINKRFSGDTVGQKCEKISLLYDPIYLYSVAEKQEMLAMNVIDSREYKISIQLPSVIRKIADEMGTGTFDDSTNAVVTEKLNAYFNKKFPVQATNAQQAQVAANG